jgi:hypothetical protein
MYLAGVYRKNGSGCIGKALPQKSFSFTPTFSPVEKALTFQEPF